MDYKISSNQLVSEYYGTETNLVFPAEDAKGKPILGVKRLDRDNNTFKDLETVVLPEGYTIIEKYAFEGCEKLKSITIPTTMTEVDYRAFDGCTSLTEIVFPNTGKVSDNDRVPTFKGCTNLKDVYYLNPCYCQKISCKKSKFTVHGNVDYDYEDVRGISGIKLYQTDANIIPLTEDEKQRFAKQYFSKPVIAEYISEHSDIKSGETLSVVRSYKERCAGSSKMYLRNMNIFKTSKTGYTGIIKEPLDKNGPACAIDKRKNFGIIQGFEEYLTFTLVSAPQKMSASSQYYMAPVEIVYKG